MRAAGSRSVAAVRRSSTTQVPTRRVQDGAPAGLHRRSVVAALLAYVLVGAFLGLAGWKLTETAVGTRQEADQAVLEAAAAAPAAPPVPTGPHQDPALLSLLQRQTPPNGIEGLY